MRRVLALAAAGLVAATTIAAGPSQQQPVDPSFEMDLAVGDSDSVGGQNAGVNPWNFGPDDDYHCEPTPHERCEVILVKVTNPYDEENARKGREKADLHLAVFSSVPPAVQDFAIRVYESDESGAAGEFIASEDNSAGEISTNEYNEAMTVSVLTTEDETERWYRVEVIFWAAAGDWRLDASFEQ